MYGDPDDFLICCLSSSQVNSSSPSEACGLQAGDVLVAVNGQDLSQCRHRDAQDAIVRAGNAFSLTIQRFRCLNCIEQAQGQLSVIARLFPC